MRVADRCVRQVETASPRESVAQAARRMVERSVGTLVVVDDIGRPLGIVTDRDLMARCLAEPREAQTPVRSVMSGPVAWIHEAGALEDALETMGRLRVRRLAVVDDRQRLVGLLALDDLLAAEHDETTALGRALRATMS